MEEVKGEKYLSYLYLYFNAFKNSFPCVRDVLRFLEYTFDKDIDETLLWNCLDDHNVFVDSPTFCAICLLIFEFISVEDSKLLFLKRCSKYSEMKQMYSFITERHQDASPRCNNCRSVTENLTILPIAYFVGSVSTDRSAEESLKYLAKLQEAIVDCSRSVQFRLRCNFSIPIELLGDNPYSVEYKTEFLNKIKHNTEQADGFTYVKHGNSNLSKENRVRLICKQRARQGNKTVNSSNDENFRKRKGTQKTVETFSAMEVLHYQSMRRNSLLPLDMVQFMKRRLKKSS